MGSRAAFIVWLGGGGPFIGEVPVESVCTEAEALAQLRGSWNHTGAVWQRKRELEQRQPRGREYCVPGSRLHAGNQPLSSGGPSTQNKNV